MYFGLVAYLAEAPDLQSGYSRGSTDQVHYVFLYKGNKK